MARVTEVLEERYLLSAVGNTFATAQVLSSVVGTPLQVMASIGDEVDPDCDMFRVDLTAGQRFNADIDARQLDAGGTLSSLNSFLRLFDSNGTLVASNDNGRDPETSNLGEDSLLSFTAATTGSYYLGVSSTLNQGYDPLTGNTSAVMTGASGEAGDFQLRVSVTNGGPAPIPAVTGIGLVNDSGVVGDGITNDPRISYTIGYKNISNTSSSSDTWFQYDLNNDGISDGVAIYQAGNASLVLDLGNSYLVPGPVDLRVRPLINDPNIEPLVYGNWSTFSFTYTPALPVVSGLSLVNDSGTPGDLITDDPRVAGNVSLPSGSVAYLPLQYDLNGDGVADGSSETESTGQFTIDLANLNLSAGSQTVAIRSGRYVNGPMSLQYGAWSTLTFTYSPPAPLRPVVTDLHLVSDTGTAGDLITADPRISGTVTHSGGSVNYLPVQYDFNGDGSADGTVYTNAAGEFIVDLSNLDLNEGALTLNVRSGEWDTNSMTHSYGTWSTLVFTYTAPVAAVSELGLTNDSGTPGDSITNDPRISGTVTMSLGSPANLTIQYDVDEDGVVDGSTLTNSLGNFSADLTSLNLPQGAYTVSIRAVTYRNSGTVAHYSSWSSGLTFTYIPTAAGGAPGDDGGTPSGGGDPPPAPTSYVLKPGQSMGMPGSATAHNYSPDPDGPEGPLGDITVSFSTGSVTINPGAGSEFNVSVDGNGNWSSSRGIGKLTFRTTGAMIVSPIDGELDLGSQGGIGDIEGSVVRAGAGTLGVGKVTAGYIKLLTAGTAKDITCSGDVKEMLIINQADDLVVGGRVENLMGSFESIDIGGDVLFSEVKVETTFRMGGNGNGIFFQATPEQITIEGSVAVLYFDGCDMSSSVNVQGSIGLIRWMTYPDAPGQFIADNGSSGGGLHVGKSIPDGSHVTANGINVVYVAHDIMGSITSTDELNNVRANGKIDNSTIIATGNIGRIESMQSLEATIQSQQGTIGHVSALTAISGSVRANLDLGVVSAISSISAAIESDRGHIQSVDAGGGITGSLKAATSIGPISSGGIIAAEIVARASSISSVRAGGSISGAMSAATTIGEIKSNLGNISGSISAGGSINAIWANLDITTSTITSGGSIGPITSESGRINSEIVAAVNLNDVMALHGDIEGSLTAGANVNDVWAGGNIGSIIHAASGNINSILAGINGGGNITGSITAGRTIGSVDAKGLVTGTPLNLTNLLSMLSGINFQDVITGQATLPNLVVPAAPAVDQGTISGNIDAGRNILSVVADGSISGTVHAGGMVSTVTSGGTISGTINSDNGAVTVSALGQIVGDITALGTVIVDALGKIENTISSSEGGARVSSFASINSEVKAHSGILEWALDTVEGTFESISGNARITGIQKILAGGSATDVVLASALLVGPAAPLLVTGDLVIEAAEIISSQPITIGRDAYVYALRDSQCYINARHVNITAWGNFSGEINATGNITIDVLEDVNADLVKSTGGEISVHADQITGTFITTSESNNVNIAAWGSFSGSVTSSKNATVSAYSNLDGNITAAGRVVVSTFGDLSGSVTGGTVHETAVNQQHSITAWGNISGAITVGSSAKVFAYGDVTQNVTLSGSPNSLIPQQLEVTVLKNMTGDITSAGDAVVSVGQDFAGDIKAGDDVNFTGFGELSGDITAGTIPNSNPNANAEVNEHVAFVSTLKSVSGNVTAADGVRVEAFGDINGDIIASAGVVEIIARVGVDGEGPGTRGAFSGKVTAGLHAGITTAGNISAAEGITGQSIDLQSGQAISVGAVTSSNGPINASAAAGLIATSLTANGSTGAINLSAGGDLDVTTFTAANDVAIDARGTVKAKGTTASGDISVRTLGGFNASDLTAAANLSVQSFGATSQLVGLALTGTLDLFSKGSISASPLIGQLGVTVSTLGSISGSGVIKSLQGAVTVYAGGGEIAAGAEITGQLGASAVARDDIAADVTSLAAGAMVESHLGNISGDVTAATAVTVVTLQGNISGDIKTASGTAVVSSAGTISGDIESATGTVDASAIGAISSPSILGGQAVTVLSYADVSAAIIESSTSSVDVVAVSNVTSSVTAWTNANVSAALGSVQGTIEAHTGSATVAAGVDVQESVTAGVDATVNALGGVFQTVSAGRDAVVNARGGGVQQTVSAGRDATVFALQDVQQTVTAGRDADVSTFGMVQGSVAAGIDASVSAAGLISGDVNAGHNATLFTADNLTGSVTATTGNIELQAWGLVQTALSAGGDASVFAGQGGSVMSDTGGALSVVAAGPLQGIINAGTSADILASGTISGTVAAGTDASVIGFSSTSIHVTAGDNALVFSGQSLQGDVIAGDTAAAISMGTISGSQIVAGESAVAYAIGSVTTVTVQADSAALISWDAVSGPSLVQGESGAYGFSYAGFYGTVAATAGSASLVTLGDVPSATTVTATVDAVAMSAGSFAGSVAAGAFGGVISLQDFNGSLSAGTDAVVLSEGALTGSVNAGRDAFAWSLGDVSGAISAVRDVAVVTFGNFTGSLTAGRDVTGVGTVGSLGGTISAARNVGSLLSYASFTANVSATNSVAEANQGTIGGVTSLGSLGGSLTAANSIGTVTSANAITASLTAPTVGTVVQFDPNLITDLTAPTAPASVRGEVLADGASALADVQADKADFNSSTQLFVSDIQQDRNDLLDDLGQSRADVIADNQTSTTETQTAVNTERQAALSDLTDERAAAAISRQAIATETDTDQQTVVASWTAMDAANQDAHDDSLEDAQVAQAAAQDRQNEATADQQTLRLKTLHDRDVDQDWSSRVPTVTGTFMAAINVVANVQATITHIQTVHADLTRLADEVDAQGFNRTYLVYGGTAADLVGLRAIVGAWDGADPYTLEEWSDGYRLFQGVMGVTTLVETALAISATASFFASPCRSPHWGSCFVGDTQVLTREIEEATTAIAILPDESQSANSLDWLTPVCILIGVAGTVIMQRQTQRRLRSTAVNRRSVLDNLFCNEDLDSAFSSLPARSYRTNHLQFGRSGMDNASFGESKHRRPLSPAVLPDERPPVRLLVTPDEYVAEEDVYSADHASPAWRPATWAWLLTWFLLGGFCFVQSSATSWTVPTLAKDAGARPAVAKRFESRAIQDIRTGMRVIADNPELNGQDAIESEISPATWRNIHLRMEKPDGSELKMTLLRSLDWLEERRGEVGRDIDVNLQELGVAGPATILAIEPCPPIETGSGKLVTGTFQHSAADVINLYVTGANEPIGTTSNHPFWSETRQDFVQAGSLERGEELRTATGKTVLVMNQVPRTESTPVFNLEVDVEHAYTVTSCGVVVHNSDSYITEHISENAALYPKLKDQLRLEALSASGIVVTNTSLHIGNRRIAVFDSATGKLYLGDSTGGGHLGVVQTHQLPVVNGRYVGGFVEIGENWRLNFNPTSGTFPYTNIDLPEGILDRLRGTGVIINGL